MMLKTIKCQGNPGVDPLSFFESQVNGFLATHEVADVSFQRNLFYPRGDSGTGEAGFGDQLQETYTAFILYYDDPQDLPERGDMR